MKFGTMGLRFAIEIIFMYFCFVSVATRKSKIPFILEFQLIFLAYFIFLLDKIVCLLWVEEGEDILISALSPEVPSSAGSQGAGQISEFINCLYF